MHSAFISFGTGGVSISQSRFLSFQAITARNLLTTLSGCFNLAIEILVISGCGIIYTLTIELFQSRNRDSCHFRLQTEYEDMAHRVPVSISQSRFLSFQAATSACASSLSKLFQSRNRDSCHFREQTFSLLKSREGMFQSRNRDSCHFRAYVTKPPVSTPNASFNLAIEILVISGQHAFSGPMQNLKVRLFQSRNRDSCHFRLHFLWKAAADICFNLAIEILVISGLTQLRHSSIRSLFQSRNRDSCHFRTMSNHRFIIITGLRFNLAIEILVISGNLIVIRNTRLRRVSISQSRFLSFQGDGILQSVYRGGCFNLAIEILVISGG